MQSNMRTLYVSFFALLGVASCSGGPDANTELKAIADCSSLGIEEDVETTARIVSYAEPRSLPGGARDYSEALEISTVIKASNRLTRNQILCVLVSGVEARTLDESEDPLLHWGFLDPSDIPDGPVILKWGPSTCDSNYVYRHERVGEVQR